MVFYVLLFSFVVFLLSQSSFDLVSFPALFSLTQNTSPECFHKQPCHCLYVLTFEDTTFGKCSPKLNIHKSHILSMKFSSVILRTRERRFFSYVELIGWLKKLRRCVFTVLSSVLYCY